MKAIKEFLTLTSQNTESFALEEALEFNQQKNKSINDFVIVRALGHGAFGRVMLAQDRADCTLEVTQRSFTP